MFIDFDDLSEESKEELLEDAREYGISEEDVIKEFNEEAGDSANALDFFDDNFIEQILRDDSGLLEDYLSFVSKKIQRYLSRRYSGRIALKKEKWNDRHRRMPGALRSREKENEYAV